MSPNPTPTTNLTPRQLWAWPTAQQTASLGGGCKNFTLSAGGTLVINPTSTLVLPTGVVYQPKCSGAAFGTESALSNDSVQQYHHPFYASVTPLVYVVAATTFVAWFLLIILFVVPGGYVSVPGRRQKRNWPGGRALLHVFTDRSSVLGFGTRPWLQKIAAILVVVALTTVSADTFKQARHQYANGYINAPELRRAVTYSIEVRAIRVVSDLFLWLAQIQTLIRLFPRHKEKLIIKWVGFLLICFDIIFSSLNSFTIADRYEPRRYQDAIPALSYLFQLALSLLYGTWVVYYAITKRRYAFYHPLMPNICLIALFSIIAVLVPVVFFLVDILQPDVGAWGDYFRWVAAAAASIIVWEWVERIEALERDEKKDGILGREVFDEDEMLDHDASDASSRTSLDRDDDDETRPQYRKVSNRIGRFGTNTGKRLGNIWDRRPQQNKGDMNEKQASGQQKSTLRRKGRLQHKDDDSGSAVAVPDPVASPVDRTQAASTGSTVYAVHYHPVTRTPPVPLGIEESMEQPAEEMTPIQEVNSTRKPIPKWRLAANVFKRSRKSPPLEVKNIMSLNGGNGDPESDAQSTNPPHGHGSFAFRKKRASAETANRSWQPTIIPAPPRGHTPWSPDTMRHTPLEEGDSPDNAAHRSDQVASIPPPVRPSSGADRLTTEQTESEPRAQASANGDTNEHAIRGTPQVPEGRDEPRSSPDPVPPEGRG